MDYGCCCIRPTGLNDFEFNGVNTEPAMATSSNTPQPQDEGLRKFLQSRGIPEENIQKMLQDRIDTSVVEEIDDDALAAYIPAYGDRIATRRFCMEKKTTGGVDSKRLSMFEKLKRKMYTKSNKDRHQDSEEEHSNMHLRNNRRASKMTRKIEIGWINDKRQVRKRNGGGTRLLDISKTATKKDILSHAKGLFFPNEKSIHGMWEEFSHDIVDFQEANLEDSISVRELYEAQKFGVLRFYLFTEHLTNREDITEMGEGADKQTDADKQQKKTAENVEQLTQKTPDSKQQSHTVEEDGQSTNKMSALVSTASEIIDLTSLYNTSEVIFGTMQGDAFLGVFDDTVPFEPILPIEDAQINTDTFTSTPIHSETVPAASRSPSFELLHVTVKLHRVNLLEELITQFKDEDMISYSVKYSFIDEVGADVDGVSRDVYAAFWTEFLDCAAEGADMRVPSLSPKWQEEEWRSLGRIMVKGLEDHGYFPFRLAQAFTAAVTFGEHSVSPDLLFDSLMLYLSQSERDLLSTALQEALVGDDEDEFLDLMDRMGVRTVPTQENLKAVLLQVAHKQIIQQPKYALDNIAAVAGPTLRKFFPSVLEIHKMYDDLRPTTRKVLKLITASPNTASENQSLRFLHQYIRGLDEIGLRKILRFMTGSDVICVKKIEVIFTSLEGLARRPIAHTCGPTLELPSTYNSYPELRSEIESILSSNSFTMDIA
ncbi:uncharacterized protein LOC128449596 [Pleuronectes platessa]|uniref:uncharacterized protein LOC128449596 n=1 Tax=Pleuronectes platessa TaxID=8262 RepID=UPI00232A1A20|nr:uncharacterized protein LOC128449596 [Pleuronectes platessa]